MKDFKIWCKTEKEKNEVISKMLSEKLTWEKRPKVIDILMPSDNVGFIVYKGEISWTDHNLAFAINILPEITPEEYTKEKEKEMRKADLKTGHLVVLRCGAELVVFLKVTTNNNEMVTEDVIVNGHRNLWSRLSNYDDDLKNIHFRESDIMKVYQVDHPFALQNMEYNKWNRKLLWERKEEPKVKEITASEAAELLKSKFSDFDEVKIVM